MSFEKYLILDCEARHHKLLQKFAAPNTSPSTALEASPTVPAHYNSVSKPFFKIVPVTLYNNNVYINIFAMLNDGSNINYPYRRGYDALGLNTLYLK